MRAGTATGGGVQTRARDDDDGDLRVEAVDRYSEDGTCCCLLLLFLPLPLPLPWRVDICWL